MLALAATTTWYTALLRAGEFSPLTFHTRILGGWVDMIQTHTTPQLGKHDLLALQHGHLLILEWKTVSIPAKQRQNGLHVTIKQRLVK